MTTAAEKSAVAAARTPFLDSLYENAPFCTLQASEEAVGLPAGQVWNSEVWHTTLWTGRVKYQDLVRISHAVAEWSFQNNSVLLDAVAYAQKHGSAIHLMGLLSDGGVHSHITHVYGLLTALGNLYDWDMFVHAFMDGRDTDPKSGVGYVADLQSYLTNTGSKAKLASVVGRYYAMDRDTRRERVKVAYDLLVHAQGEYTNDVLWTMNQRYEAGESDEFIQPIRCLEGNRGVIKPHDVVLFFNFRSDRAREITSCLTQHDYPEYGMQTIPDLRYVCMTEYDASFAHMHVLFPSQSMTHVLGEVLADHHKTQLRIAETEKYPHVTFFFNGGTEESYEGESRIMVPSPKVATYDMKPEMSAYEVTDECMHFVKEHMPGFICLNYANPDMVGHTWVFEAVVKACETVDQCTQKLAAFLLEDAYTLIILADHGNADYMRNDDGSPNTAHSLALVPCFLLWWHMSDVKLRQWTLADIAPTILQLMGIEKPREMTGESIVI